VASRLASTTFLARADEAEQIVSHATGGEEGRTSGMGTEVRTCNGGRRTGAEEKRATSVLMAAAPAEVPTSAASVDISLPFPEMTPHIMQVPTALPPLLESYGFEGRLRASFRDGVGCVVVSCRT
jgi:hypothetical protein